jgi:hypothetical protein
MDPTAATAQPIPLEELLPALLLGAVLLLMHDGRHLLGAPCH